MNINWMRLIIAVVAAYATYAVLYIGSMVLIFPEMETIMAEIGRSEADLQVWIHIGHVIETIVIALIYFIFVKSNDARTGVTFGAMMGLYYAAMQMTVMGSVANYPVDMTFQFIPVHIIVGAVVGFVLAKIYRGPANAAGGEG